MRNLRRPRPSRGHDPSAARPSPPFEIMPVAAWVDERHWDRWGFQYWATTHRPDGPDPRSPPADRTSSPPASRACRTPASKCCWTWCSTTPASYALGPRLLRGLDQRDLLPHARRRRPRVMPTTRMRQHPRPRRARCFACDGHPAPLTPGGGVDGSAFDLATTLARGAHRLDAAAPLLQAIARTRHLRGSQARRGNRGTGARRPSPRRLPAGWGELEHRPRVAHLDFCPASRRRC